MTPGPTSRNPRDSGRERGLGQGRARPAGQGRNASRGPAHAALDPVAVRRLTQSLLTASPGASAIAVGLYRAGQRAFVLRGRTARDGAGAPVETATRFEVGSLTKTFTALLLAEQAARGELGLHDALARWLPPGTRLPPGGTGITLTHLATHTSGLPRLPPGLPRTIGPRLLSNPYAAFTAEDVRHALPRAQLRGRPGACVRYSNFAVGVLGHALSGAAGGGPYESLLAARVLGPLGLHDTDCADYPRSGALQVTGHWYGRPRPPFRIPGMPAAGAVRSSVRDMLTVAEAFTDPDAADAPGPLPAALRDVTVPRLVVPRDGSGLCLVWNIRPRPDGSHLYHHSGGTLGCTAFVGFNPQHRTALVALANSAPGWRNSLIQAAYDTVLRLSDTS